MSKVDFDGVGHPFLDDQVSGPWSGVDPDPTTRAIVGEPDPSPQAGHPGFLALLDEMRETHVRKAADYGTDADPLHNVRCGADLLGIPHWHAAMIRANDKVVRVGSFIRKGTLANESLQDSLLDLANYALIALALFNEEHGR